MIRHIFILSALIFSLVIPHKSFSNLHISDYSTVINLSGKDIFKLNKGDDTLYKNPDFDDSSWRTVSLPDNWMNHYPGYKKICWYRITLTLPDKKPAYSIGIRLGMIYDTDEIYFNGVLIGKTGKFPPYRLSKYDVKRLYEIPVQLLRPGAKNVIALRVHGLFPNANGPTRDKFFIGPFKSLHRDLLSEEFINIIFIVLYCAVGIYVLSFYLKKSAGVEFLLFSMYTFLSSTYFFFRTQIKFFIFDNYQVMKKIEYLALFFAFFVLFEFITTFFKRKRNFLHYLFAVLTTIAAFIIIISEDYILWHYVLYYGVQPSWLIPLTYFFAILFKDIKKEADYKYIAISLMILILTAANDIMVDRGLYNFIRVSQFGFLFLIISISIILHNRYLALYLTVEDLEKKKQKKKEPTDLTKVKVDEALDYIAKHYKESITREDIADDLAMNPDTLGKSFKKVTGMRLNDYINEVRVKDAAQQLTATEVSIIQIAYDVGFESMSTFYRVFQKVIGESPSSYRGEVDENEKI